MTSDQREFTVQVFLAPNRYGAQLAQEWLLHDHIESLISSQLDSNNNAESRRGASFGLLCKPADVEKAESVLAKLNLVSHRIQADDRILLFPEWDDEDLLEEMIETMHQQPNISLAAYMELLRRDKAPTQREIDALLADFHEGWLSLEEPAKVTLLHYLKALLLPPWGFYVGAKMMIRGRKRFRQGAKWGSHHNDVSIGAVTLLVSFGSLTCIWVLGYVKFFMSR